MNNVLPQPGGCIFPATLCLCLACSAAAQQTVNSDALTNAAARHSREDFAQQAANSDALTNQYPFQTTVTNQFAPPPILPVPSGPTTPGTGQAGAPSMGTSVLTGSSASLSSAQVSGHPMVSWGPIGVYPHLLYRFTYGNGLESAQSGENTKMVIQTLSPGVLLGLGDHWTLDYNPLISFYSSSLYHDTVGESVLLHGVATNGDWILGLAQSYVLSTQPLVETGAQTAEEGYATALTAAAQLNDKWSLQMGLNQNFRFAQNYPSLHEWTTTGWLNYEIEPQLGLAIGPAIGYDELSAGSDMPFEDIKGRITFKPGTKLVLSVDGGAEDRQFIHPSAPPMVTPVFDASAYYRIFPGTEITLLASRVVTPSLYENQINVITSVNATFRQHLVKEIYLELGAGRTTEPFTSIVAAPLPQFFIGAPPQTTLQQVRNDSTDYGKISLSATFRKRLTGSLFYYASKNVSSQINFSYSSTQMGMELSYRY